MSDFGTMVARIKREIHRSTSYDDTVIKDAIIDAIKTWRYTRFSFNVRTWSLEGPQFDVIETGPPVIETLQRDYAFPTTDIDSIAIAVITVDSLKVCRGGERGLLIDPTEPTSPWYPLTSRPIQWFDETDTRFNHFLHEDGVPTGGIETGLPSYYCVTNNKRLRFYPNPNGIAFTVQGVGLCNINNLTNQSADTASNPWMVEGESLIRSQAKLNLYIDNFTDLNQISILERQVARHAHNLTLAQGRLSAVTEPVAWY